MFLSLVSFLFSVVVLCRTFRRQNAPQTSQLTILYCIHKCIFAVGQGAERIHPTYVVAELLKMSRKRLFLFLIEAVANASGHLANNRSRGSQSRNDCLHEAKRELLQTETRVDNLLRCTTKQRIYWSWKYSAARLLNTALDSQLAFFLLLCFGLGHDMIGP